MLRNSVYKKRSRCKKNGHVLYRVLRMFYTLIMTVFFCTEFCNMTVFFTSYSAPCPFFLQSILHTIPHTIPHTIYNTISHTIYSTILPTCSPTYAEPCGQSHYEVVQKKYVWTGAVRRRGAWSRPRGLGGGPESPQEPQWDTAAALGSGGEGGK